MSRRASRGLDFNRRQMRVLVLGGAILLAMLLFPPWVFEYRAEDGAGHTVFAGLRFVFMPPEPVATYQYSDTHLDYLMLGIELLGVLAFVVLAVRSMSDGLPRVQTHHRSFR